MNNDSDLRLQTSDLRLAYAYTRAQAVADGVQVEVMKVAAEAGIRFPVFLTRTVYDTFVSVPEGVTAQDEAGRLWPYPARCALNIPVRSITSGIVMTGTNPSSRMPWIINAFIRRWP